MGTSRQEMELLGIALLGWLAGLAIAVALLSSAARADELESSLLEEELQGSRSEASTRPVFEAALEPLAAVRSPSGSPFFPTPSARRTLAEALQDLRRGRISADSAAPAVG